MGEYQREKGSVAECMDNIRRIIQVVNEQSKKIERETGLTGPQLWAVKIISEISPVRVSDLAKSMYLHQSTVVGIVDRLEKHGLVVRERSRDDRRVVEVTLTAEGQQHASHSPEVTSNKIIHGLESLPSEELSMIHRGLDSLVRILDAQGIAPRLIGDNNINGPHGEAV